MRDVRDVPCVSRTVKSAETLSRAARRKLLLFGVTHPKLRDTTRTSGSGRRAHLLQLIDIDETKGCGALPCRLTICDLLRFDGFSTQKKVIIM